MGVGVEAPGRDHHSMTSPTEQSHNMTNGFNSDNHGRNSGGKYKIIYRSQNILECITITDVPQVLVNHILCLM